MKQVLLIIGIIVLSITANSQDLSTTFVTGSIDQGNYFFSPIDSDFETLHNNWPLWGDVNFSDSLVTINYKRKERKRKLTTLDFEVKSVVKEYDSINNRAVYKYEFVILEDEERFEDFWTKGILRSDGERWEFFSQIDGETIYYTGLVE